MVHIKEVKMFDDSCMLYLNDTTYKQDYKTIMVMCKRGKLSFMGEIELDGTKFDRYVIVKKIDLEAVLNKNFTYQVGSSIGRYVYVEKKRV